MQDQTDPNTDRKTVENAITFACNQGWMVDARELIKTANERYNTNKYTWPKRSIKQVLGQCTHHNASKNITDPSRTADYHTDRENHITYGRPLPSIIYPICIPANGEVLITGDLLDRTYGQAYGSLADGDENLHLVPVLVMGDFTGPGNEGRSKGPTTKQSIAHTMACQWLSELFSFGAEGNFYHSHFGKPACPGYELMRKIDSWRKHGTVFDSVQKWQAALLRWDDCCLPKYGADGVWGRESKLALIRFQRAKGLYVTAMRDPFTQLVLIRDCSD